MAKNKQLYGAAKFTHTLKQHYGNGESMAKGIENISAASEKAGIIKGATRVLFPVFGRIFEKRK